MITSALLEHLAQGPREDGTPELAQAAQWLFDELVRRGFTPERFEYVAHPWRLRAVGLVALAGAAAYAVSLLKGRRLVAALITLAVPAWVVVELDFSVPVLGWLHPVSQQHVIATVAASEAPRQQLVLSAHYDTKTDLLDHVERAPLTLLALPLTLVMLLATRFQRLRKAGFAAAVLNGLGQFLVQTGGAFVPARSPGALDDGASCAVLLEVASALKAQPLQRTEVRVVFFSGEEIGLEGARAWVARGLARTLPTQVINLDGVGASNELAVYAAESGVARRYAPDAQLVQRVDSVSKLSRPWYPATTDALAFLEAGVPAVNLSSEPAGGGFPRGLHSRADAVGRVSYRRSTRRPGVAD